MSLDIDFNLISIRDISESEIPQILNYWFHSPAGFIESMGADLTKLPTESVMARNLAQRILENRKLASSKLNALAILYKGTPIGFHTLFPIVERDYGIFHAHIWNIEFRRKGIGTHSYPKACRIFLERFGLERILFKTPIQNFGALKVKVKLGIRSIGEEMIEFGIIKAGTKAKVFELTLAEAQSL